MDSQDLSLDFLWIPQEGDLDELNQVLNNKTLDENLKLSAPLLKLKTNVSNFCGFPIFIKDYKTGMKVFNENNTKQCSTSENLFNAGCIVDVTCTVKVEKNAIEDFLKFSDKFCFTKHGRLYSELLLKFDSSYYTAPDNSMGTNVVHISLKKFSLGNYVSLNKFYANFDSQIGLEKYKHKITQINLLPLHDYKKLILFFVIGKKCNVKKRSAQTHLLYKVEIPYSSLHSIIVSKADTFSAYIHFLQTPLLHAVVHKEDQEDYTTLIQAQSPSIPWQRAINVCDEYDFQKVFIMNRVLKLEFCKNECDDLYQILTHAQNVNLYFAPIQVTESIEQPTSLKLKLEDFNCSYAMECILSHSSEIMDQMKFRKEYESTKNFITEKAKLNPTALAKALFRIYDGISSGNFIPFYSSLKHLYDKFSGSEIKNGIQSISQDSNIIEQEHIILIRRAILIPNHCFFLPAEPSLKSKALRDCNPDFSMRVSIRDCDLDTLNFSLRKNNNLADREHFFNTYIMAPILKGIKVEKRTYHYVASSTSQLKGHGLWFYARDKEDKTADVLRKRFGHLDNIKSVPKYMARMGQSFSQSLGFITVPQTQTNVKNPDPDVEHGKKQLMDLDFQIEKKFKRRKRTFLVESASFTNEAHPDDQNILLDEETKDNEKDLDKCSSNSLKDKDLAIPIQERIDSEEEEIEDPDPYCFSDGIGRISEELASEVYVALSITHKKPCALQIRYAGCKGMLDVDPNLKGKMIRFRESMRKFDSDHESLEILKYSDKRSALLNRPLVTILEQLGVHRKIFLQLQKKMIHDYITSMFHESSACKFLHTHSYFRTCSYPNMHAAGFRLTEDPLFRSMIHALFQMQIKLLKDKASIEIPVDKGRAMFGVLDETFTLEYGQVFVQYSDWITDEPIIVEGTIVVTKNPCMHPGDVRKFTAVDVESLHHIKDCIVFPAKGDRPHPDEMAGSDLDGDEYHVMWMEELIFPKENFPPMHYAVEKNINTLDRPIKVQDELKHFRDYIFADNVGMIANAHLALADQKKKSIFDPLCIRLAKRYSLALDFAKSGVPADFPYEDRAIEYPDFMQKLNEKKTYLSRNALGLLYRNCKRLDLGLETEFNEIEWKIDNDFVHEKWADYKKSALRVYKRYCERVKKFISMYGFENEGQMLAGAIINTPKHYENRHDLNNLTALIEFEVQSIFSDIEKVFFREFNGKQSDGIFTDKMLQKASAWYMVAYEDSSHYFGFPWAVTDVLLALKTKNQSLKGSSSKPSKTLLEKVVDSSIAKDLPDLTPETESSVIHANCMEVLDVACKTLMGWITCSRTREEYFSGADMKEIKQCISKEFDLKTEKMVGCSVGYIDRLKETGDIKMAISPCYHIIETMLHIADIGALDPLQPISNSRQELGLFSWITLIKLACSYDPRHLGISNEAGSEEDAYFYKPYDDVIDHLHLQIFDSKDEDENSHSFSNALLSSSELIKSYLLEQSKLKMIDYRTLDEKGGRYFVRFTVKGSRFAIERLKDMVVKEDFFKNVIEGIETMSCRDNITDTIQISDVKNTKFHEALMSNYEHFKFDFKNKFNLVEMDFEIPSISKDKYIVKFIVKGSKYSIANLKDKVESHLKKFKDEVINISREDFKDTLTLQFYEDEKPDFCNALINNPEHIKLYVADHTKLKKVDFTVNVGQSHIVYFVNFNVEGSKYALDQFRDVVRNDSFYKNIVTDLTKDDITDTFRLPLFKGENANNLKFVRIIDDKLDYIRLCLVDKTKLKMDYKVLQGQRGKHTVKFTADPSMYVLERLQYMIKMDDIFKNGITNTTKDGIETIFNGDLSAENPDNYNSKTLAIKAEQIKIHISKFLKLKEIDFRIIHNEGTDFVKFTVEGSRYAIKRFKDLNKSGDLFKTTVAGILPL